MWRAKRPFDDKPATACLICGTDIASGNYCLTCIPPSVQEGPSSWVNHRWFSGPVAAARKRRIERIEHLQSGFIGATMIAAALFAMNLSIPRETLSLKDDSAVAVRHAAKMPWKVRVDATKIS